MYDIYLEQKKIWSLHTIITHILLFLKYYNRSIKRPIFLYTYKSYYFSNCMYTISLNIMYIMINDYVYYIIPINIIIIIYYLVLLHAKHNYFLNNYPLNFLVDNSWTIYFIIKWIHTNQIIFRIMYTIFINQIPPSQKKIYLIIIIFQKKKKSQIELKNVFYSQLF